MKKFLVLGFVVFAALFLAIGCDDGDSGSNSNNNSQPQQDNCNTVCADWANYYASRADCEIDCKHYENGGADLNEYVSECINAGHSVTDCEAWYYEK